MMDLMCIAVQAEHYTTMMDSDVGQCTTTSKKNEGKFNTYWPPRRMSVMTTLPTPSSTVRRVVTVHPGRYANPRFLLAKHALQALCMHGMYACSLHINIIFQANRPSVIKGTDRAGRSQAVSHHCR